MAEVLGLVRIMDESESVAAGVNVLIRHHSITNDVDVALDLRFLQHLVSLGVFYSAEVKDNSQPDHCS